ncbi:MAG: ABC transporter ATP-binding protein [Proteobacteria bacterium]|nr:ABC transporter ATP-binding protein [Pseudomonadota bacterium]
MIKLEKVEKIYQRGSERVRALKGIDLEIERGEFLSIVGPSGSGKTTLLHILGCLDTPTSGIVRLDGIDIETMPEKELVKIRREKIGYIFQQFYLIPGLTVYENVSLPLTFSRKERNRSEIENLIEMVGLKDRINHKPNQLSGGEMQRTAIARALVNNPEFILADEPTGNLDSENAEMIFELLKSLHNKGISIILITHNPDLAQRTERIIKLKDGIIESDQMV